MKSEYDLIVFDWDGTLMDSAAKIVNCFSAAFADAGVASPGQAAIRHVIGLGLQEAVNTLLPTSDAATRAQVSESYRAHFMQHDQTETGLFPGVQQGLEELVQQGYLLAIATGKARRGLDRVLEQTATAHRFCATRCAGVSFSQPHPRLLYDILAYTGHDAASALMVGDTSYDLQMARAAAMDSLGVTYGAHSREHLLPHAPLACLDSFIEVSLWLQRRQTMRSAAANT